jgi:hypothetical protein
MNVSTPAVATPGADSGMMGVAAAEVGAAPGSHELVERTAGEADVVDPLPVEAVLHIGVVVGLGDDHREALPGHRLIRIIASHSGIDRTTACGRPGKRLQ